jgi:tripartite-type tricarboxylate transporter receptor subunit TctC
MCCDKSGKTSNRFRNTNRGSVCRARYPYILPPGTPKELVEILQEALRKTFKDREFHREFKKLTGDDPTPLMPEAHEKAIRELPRDSQIVELFKKLAGAEPLSPR